MLKFQSDVDPPNSIQYSAFIRLDDIFPASSEILFLFIYRTQVGPSFSDKRTKSVEPKL